jgi:phosphomannomutase
MPFIRSISGIRATLGDALTPSVIADYVAAFAAYLPEGAVVVGRDGRPSGVWIEQIVCGTLAACGREVHVLDLVPTPTVQLFAERDGMAGGISITASHNPVEWNGMKFFNARGLYLNADENAAFWQVHDERDNTHTHARSRFITGQHGGEVTHITDPLQQHIEAILRLPLFTPEAVRAVQQRAFRVVVDAVNCSGSFIVPRLLETLGCEVIGVHCDASGDFPHTPEPLPENLQSLAAAVGEHRADIGIAVDPDADRLVLIDERGKAIGEEYTIVLTTLAVLMNKDFFVSTAQMNPAAPVVVNLSTTQAVADVAAKFGVKTLRTAVGEINVVNAMLQHGSLVGGEGSGGVIVPSCHAGRDALVGAALVLLLMAQTLDADTPTLSALVAAQPQYAMLKSKQGFVGGADVVTSIFAKVRAQFPTAQVNTDDGLRLDFSHDDGNDDNDDNGGSTQQKSWVHLRTSNTEPIIRAIAEAPTAAQAQTLVDACLAAIRG